jgi:hypothetical protein
MNHPDSLELVLELLSDYRAHHSEELITFSSDESVGKQLKETFHRLLQLDPGQAQQHLSAMFVEDTDVKHSVEMLCGEGIDDRHSLEIYFRTIFI